MIMLACHRYCYVGMFHVLLCCLALCVAVLPLFMCCCVGLSHVLFFVLFLCVVVLPLFMCCCFVWLHMLLCCLASCVAVLLCIAVSTLILSEAFLYRTLPNINIYFTVSTSDEPLIRKVCNCIFTLAGSNLLI